MAPSASDRLMSRRFGVAVAIVGLLALSGCYDDGYAGYGAYGGGYGGDAYYGGAYGDGVYGYGGYGYPAYGWTGGFYYPGAGVYVYDRSGHRYPWHGGNRHGGAFAGHPSRHGDGAPGGWRGHPGVAGGWHGGPGVRGGGGRGLAAPSGSGARNAASPMARPGGAPRSVPARGGGHGHR